MVAKTLGERPFESLTGLTAGGLPVEPLHAPASAPAAFPPRPFHADRAWDLRTASAHPDPARANAELLADLEGGAGSVLLKLDPTGRAGIAVGAAEDLARALDGVLPEMATVALDAGFLGPAAADWLGAAAKASPAANLAFHLDPLTAFAAAGESPGPIEAHLIAAANVGARLGQTYPRAQLFLASGQVAHEAGAGEALELAFATTAALAYARALVRAGLPAAEAFGRITLGLSADADYFLTIARLRAARLVWAKVAVAAGAEALARIEARSSRRMLAAQDGWTNMIRLTLAGFGAAAGGADAVVLGCFTDALGLPTAFARRQSRNTQLVLMEESHVGRVADPAAGSGHVEALTEAIAREAWRLMQRIEAAGGLARALETGLVAELLAAQPAPAEDPKIVGVTVFPPAEESPVEVERPTSRIAEAPSPRLPGPDSRCPSLAPRPRVESAA